MKSVIRNVFSGIMVYGIVAACSQSKLSLPDLTSQLDGGVNNQNGNGGAWINGAGGNNQSNGGSSNQLGAGGNQVAGNGGALAGDSGSLLDAMTNPVKDAKADPVSGTRLKAKYIQGADGSRYYTGQFHDTQLNIDCYLGTSFGTIAMGTFCYPSNTAPGNYFADSNCTQPAGLSYACPVPGGPVPDYLTVTTTPTAACQAGTTTYYQAVASPNAVGLWAKSGANCVDASSSLAYETTAGLIVYTAGNKIDVSTFAQGTQQTE